MLSFLFDVETTGTTSKDEVIQLAGFLVQDFTTIKKIVNFYCETDRDSHPAALAQHKLTPAILHEKSNGLTFEQQFEKILPIIDVPDITFVSYNAAFDTSKVTNTLKNNGAKPFVFPKIEATLNATGRHTFCLMNACTSFVNHGIKRKNSEMATSPAVLQFLYNTFNKDGKLSLNGIKPTDKDKLMEAANGLFKIICEKNGIDANANLHDGLYDTYLSWFVFQTYGPKFML